MRRRGGRERGGAARARRESRLAGRPHQRPRRQRDEGGTRADRQRRGGGRRGEDLRRPAEAQRVDGQAGHRFQGQHGQAGQPGETLQTPARGLEVQRGQAHPGASVEARGQELGHDQSARAEETGESGQPEPAAPLALASAGRRSLRQRRHDRLDELFSHREVLEVLLEHAGQPPFAGEHDLAGGAVGEMAGHAHRFARRDLAFGDVGQERTYGVAATHDEPPSRARRKARA